MHKLKDFISEYRWIGIVVIILAYFMWPLEGESNDSTALEESTPKSAYTVKVNSNDVNGEDTLKIESTNEGFDLVDQDGVVITSIDGDKSINDFVKAINNNREYKIDKDLDDEVDIHTPIGIILDNTYSFRNNTLDKTLPDKRLNDAIKYLENNNTIKNGTIGKIGWLFSYKYGTPEVQMNDEVFSFKIDQGEFSPAIVGHKYQDSSIQYVATRKKLVINNISLERKYLTKQETDKNNCIYTSTYDFTCRTSTDFFNEIKSIYASKYNEGDDQHYGTFLLDYMFTKGFYITPQIYIFSDGEFQISKETSKAYLGNVNAGYKLNSTLEFSAQEFNKNITWFDAYWGSISKALDKKIIQCTNNEISFIGLTSDSAPFINFAKSMYNKIFQGCNIKFY